MTLSKPSDPTANVTSYKPSQSSIIQCLTAADMYLYLLNCTHQNNP